MLSSQLELVLVWGVVAQHAAPEQLLQDVFVLPTCVFKAALGQHCGPVDQATAYNISIAYDK